jgi:serine/threonine protein phosphatase PrpC
MDFTNSMPVQQGQFRYRWQVGGGTDIGGSKENQDDFFVWEDKSKGIIVLAIFDGHGRDVGKAAAEAGRRAMHDFLSQNCDRLFTEPYQCLVQAFENSHACIKMRFREKLEASGWEVMEAEEGYLLKRKPHSPTWFCVHGGTSCSVVAVVGPKVYTANVGDSSGLLCSLAPDLSDTLLSPLGDAAYPDRKLPDSTPRDSPTSVSETSLVITAEHSPESVDEFHRLHKFYRDELDPTRPALKIVYDAQQSEKHRCPSVFEFDQNGAPLVTNRGKYYKNVRREWASLVATPTTARFQDALAFTRSMGDLHLHIYGVTHLPEVHELDVYGLLRLQTEAHKQKQSESATHALDSPLVCVVLASDGVWDNWLYSDVSKFVMDSSCINAVRSSGDGAIRVAESFMKRNTLFSKRNFGAQADNATGICLYLCLDETFPECAPP